MRTVRQNQPKIPISPQRHPKLKTELTSEQAVKIINKTIKSQRLLYSTYVQEPGKKKIKEQHQFNRQEIASLMQLVKSKISEVVNKGKAILNPNAQKKVLSWVFQWFKELITDKGHHPSYRKAMPGSLQNLKFMDYFANGKFNEKRIWIALNHLKQQGHIKDFITFQNNENYEETLKVDTLIQLKDEKNFVYIPVQMKTKSHNHNRSFKLDSKRFPPDTNIDFNRRYKVDDTKVYTLVSGDLSLSKITEELLNLIRIPNTYQVQMLKEHRKGSPQSLDALAKTILLAA